MKKVFALFMLFLFLYVSVGFTDVTEKTVQSQYGEFKIKSEEITGTDGTPETREVFTSPRGNEWEIVPSSHECKFIGITDISTKTWMIFEHRIYEYMPEETNQKEDFILRHITDRELQYISPRILASYSPRGKKVLRGFWIADDNGPWESIHFNPHIRNPIIEEIMEHGIYTFLRIEAKYNYRKTQKLIVDWKNKRIRRLE
ncbi:MAG: hypothetical protein G01um101418_160 [Parcubacteria group bacterium Gr01-1014_18]|nr:MAG: hypothetical protein Greene041636_465 [Parcubacteria group bacterium Greene0416_36]TSC81487.1 MAG: hypothetical protein G01um101418_160 [Parcubacteria group bacterium Gr01-1014_18]TSC99085.1 MAG: hypothetical protein Greene101420_441 [Parcubacteria group bacterium Greene1014_20]TSD07235.1 MAG: hypothetical protein Greene07142_251 [Parcubacteria group bacterium Greene0714_2]